MADGHEGKSRIGMAAAAAVTSLLAVSQAQALPYFWDPNPDPGLNGGSGTWDLTSQNWATQDVSSNYIPAIWSNNEVSGAYNSEANFGGVDAPANSPFVISVYDANTEDGNLGTIATSLVSNPGPITFTTSGYVLQGAAPGTTLNTRSLNVAAGKSATIGNNLSLYYTSTAGFTGATFNNGSTATSEAVLTFASGSKYGIAAGKNLGLTSYLKMNVESGSAIDVGGNFTIGAGNTPGNASTLNINGGSVKVAGNMTVSSVEAGAGIVNLNSGDIDLTVATKSFQFVGTTALTKSALNLNGGTLTTAQITRASTAYARLNFNGGLLKVHSTASTTFRNAFLTGLTNASFADSGAYVQLNGAKIDTNRAVATDTVTISQALLHDPLLGSSLDGGLIKSGMGVLVLNGANTYNGLTVVQAGALGLTGSAINTVTGGVQIATGAAFIPGTAYTVGTGKTLGGGGSIINGLAPATGVLVDASGAVVAPGDSPGTLEIQGGLTLNDASTLNFEFNGAPGGANDSVALTTATLRALVLDGTLNITNLGGMTAGNYTLFSGATLLTDLGLVVGSSPAGFDYEITSDSSNVYLSVTIPEPASAALLMLGLPLLGRRRRVAVRS